MMTRKFYSSTCKLDSLKRKLDLLKRKLDALKSNLDSLQRKFLSCVSIDQHDGVGGRFQDIYSHSFAYSFLVLISTFCLLILMA